jgi:putative transposase
MARPLRIEFPDAVYHFTSRGDRAEPIFVDDKDRQGLLGVVAQALSRFDAQALSYCLMDNHYHFVLHTRQANLSSLMRHINGVYTPKLQSPPRQSRTLVPGCFKAALGSRRLPVKGLPLRRLLRRCPDTCCRLHCLRIRALT